MCVKGANGREYDKIRCFFVINKKQIYGPVLPTLGGSSDMTMASLHAEEGTIKLVESLGIPLKMVYYIVFVLLMIKFQILIHYVNVFPVLIVLIF